MESTAVSSRRLQGEDGANLVEYALLVSLIMLVCVTAASYFADATNTKMSSSASSIQEAHAGS